MKIGGKFGEALKDTQMVKPRGKNPKRKAATAASD